MPHLCAQHLTVVLEKRKTQNNHKKIPPHKLVPAPAQCWSCLLRSCLRKLYHIFPLIMLLSLLAFYLRYPSQLALCEQGVGEICLYFPLPHEISLPCDGDSLGQSTSASHLIPLIYHHVSLRNRRISLSATVAPQFTPANNNKVKPGANVGDYRRTPNYYPTMWFARVPQTPFFPRATKSNAVEGKGTSKAI